MPSKVMPPFWRRETDLLKPGSTRTRRRSDYDVGSPEYGLPVVGGIRAKVEAHCLRIEAVIEVVEDLVEVVDAKEQLIRQSCGERRVQNSRKVVDVEGGDFEI